jgi:GT2 family glycosyltransferase
VSLVDVVVVSFNSAAQLRACVEPLSRLKWARVIVVDNASTDSSLATIDGLDLLVVASQDNGGFASGCNLGWRAGSSPFVLFLNPDAYIDGSSLRRLVRTLESRPSAAISAPRIVDDQGELQHSLRRFPRLRSTYAQALFLDRIAPTAAWADEVVRGDERYSSAGPQQWVSGACMLVRRSALERVGGWDAGFFLYCEDIDLCRRLHDLGLEVYFEPAAVATHIGGGSAPRASTLPVLAASRVRYAALHRSRTGALAERIGIGLEAATHMLLGRGGRATRLGHAESLRVSLARGTSLR